jgi:hypothetical protein
MVYFVRKHDCEACALKPQGLSERSCAQNRALRS